MRRFFLFTTPANAVNAEGLRGARYDQPVDTFAGGSMRILSRATAGVSVLLLADGL